jgi:hypothetical protein
MSSVVESYRGRSVRVFRVDRDGCLDRLRAGARRLLDLVPDVVEVRLFGSLARGEEHPGSDADLLVVLRGSALPFPDRAPPLHAHLTGIGLGCDLFPYTEAELERLLREGNPLVRAAMAEGVVLARR